jgi:hypothetical protein
MDLERLHPKLKGNLGEAVVAADLIRRGYAVFTERGDLSRVDLLAQTDSARFIRIQVKCYRATNGSVVVKSEKRGPGYRFRYRVEDVDLFAIYVYDRDVLLYVPSREICGRHQTTFRLDAPRNGQKVSIRRAEAYFDFDSAIRGIVGWPL